MLGIVLFSQCPGELGHSRTGEAVFQHVGRAKIEPPAHIGLVVVQGNIPLLYKLLQIVFARAKGAVLVFEFCIARRPVCQFHVKIPDTALIGRGQHQARKIGGHARHKRTGRHAVVRPAALGVVGQNALQKIAGHLRIHHVPQLKQIPARFPECVRVVLIVYGLAPLHGQLPCAAVFGRIGTVHITAHAAAQQGMIQPCIELLLVDRIGILDLDTTQRLSPRSMGMRSRLVECQVRSFGLQILPGIVHTGVRHTHLDHNLFLVPRGKGDVKARAAPLNSFPIREQLGIHPAVPLQGIRVGRVLFHGREGADCFGRLAQFRVEVEWDMPPRVIKVHVERIGHDPAADRALTHLRHLGIDNAATLALAVAYVKNDV